MWYAAIGAFSPLLIEEGTATPPMTPRASVELSFQSSTYRGRHCNSGEGARARLHTDRFQSSTYRGRHCNAAADRQQQRHFADLSVLYLSRKALQQKSLGGLARELAELSVLYLSRKALQRSTTTTQMPSTRSFQSSTYRGRHCNRIRGRRYSTADKPFSPLLIEEGTAT